MEIKFTTHYFFCKKNFLQRILSTLLLLFSTSVYSFPSDKVFLQNNIVKVEIEEDKEVTIDEVFDILRKQTKYSFIYRENLFADLKKVSLKKGTIPVNQLLKESLSMKNYRFELIKNNKILVSKVKSKKTEEFQFEVMGNVSDSKGVPLPSASILEKGTTNGVQTDFDGNFIINTSSSNPVLIISYIGFTPKEVSVNGSSTISVVLEESASALDEVLVIGYGSLSNRKVSSAIFSVSADEIKDAKTPTVDQALIGKVPGLQIKQVSGQPGSSSVIRIRGDASITTDNSPLYVIDGFPVNLPYNETQSPLQLLNPNDIESISILKDAASTSIYGSRGSNGVVIIKTKSAKEGKSEISVNYNSMLQTYHPHSKIKVLNGEQFAQYAIDQIEDPMRANGIPIPTDQSHIPEDYRNPKSIGAGTDWFEEITQVAMSNTFDINFSNGNEKSKSFISLGYFNQEGIIKYTEFERITARANLNFKPSEIFSTGVNIAPSLSWGRQAPTGGSTWFAQSVLSSAYQASPIVSPYNEEGELRPYIESSGTFGYPNPLHILREIDDQYKNFSTLINGYFQANLQNGIILKTTGNLFYYNKKGDYFKSSEVRNWLGGDIPNNASSRISNLATINWVWENTLNYSKTIHDNHNFDILLGATAEKLTSESHTLSGDKFPNDIVRTVQNGEFDNVRSSKIEQTLISYLGRINYSYKDKYLASFTMRRDGSSRFGPNRKWGNFPSASLGWRISDEEFMSNIPLLNDLKLRTSYGLTGNKEIGDYRFISPLVRSDYTLNGQVRAGQNIAGFENPDLSWERSNQFDIGFDLLFHDNRYSLSVDYYLKTTKDMLLTIPVASASGYGSAITNIGLMENKGMEFSLNANNNVGEISIDTNLNLSFNRNTVLETNAFNDPIFDGFNITTVGYPISSFHGSVADGIIQNQAEFDAAPRASNASWEGIGGPNYLDIDGDGRHNFGDDFTIIGNPEPDFVYGFSSRFEYKNFDLSFVFNGQKGGQLLAATKQWYFLFEGPLVNQAAEVLDRWRSEENPGGGSIPIASSASVRYRFVNSDWVENNSYLWLRNVNLGWTLPKNFIEKAGLKNAKVNFTALNTLLLSKNKWSMPEASRGGNSATQQGADENSYPIPMSFSLGLNISL